MYVQSEGNFIYDILVDKKANIKYQNIPELLYVFFIENPHYKLVRYEPIKNGVRVYFNIIS